MTNGGLTNKLTYLGAGCGIVLFALFGLLPGSFLGGAVGLRMAIILIGRPAAAGIIARLTVAASMVAGVMVSAILFIAVCAAAGWLMGAVLGGAGTAEEKELVPVRQK